MIEDVKRCVDARANFFDEYFTISETMQNEVSSFKKDIIALGEKCGSAAEFEECFVKTGLSDRFNEIIPKCTPKKRKMTKEEKQYSKRVMKEMLVENKEEIIKDAAADAAGRIFNDLKDKAITKNREKMIEDGTFTDYTITRNHINNGRRIADFLKNKFGKK